jgi:segregation and condensation protein A
MSAEVPVQPPNAKAAPSYKVTLDVFEGPLDLLLYLVRRSEVEIYDIRLGKLTHDYLEFLTSAGEINVEHGADFIAMAAQLIYWKSRQLLPVDQQAEEEGPADENDPQWELIRQLIEYKKFKEAAMVLRERQMAQWDAFRRAADATEQLTPSDEDSLHLGEVGMLDLLNALERVLKRIEKRSTFREIERDKFTVADKMQFLLDTVRPGETRRFTDFFEDANSKLEVVVTFLAMLELIRLRHFMLVQEIVFGEIFLTRRKSAAQVVITEPEF